MTIEDRRALHGPAGRFFDRLALDLYCGGGGASRGMQQAGFHVTGVDVNPQPNYCGDHFIQSDAIAFLESADLGEFDFVWASPPCQRYTNLRYAPGKHRDADLVAPTRELLKRSGKPWCIENVEGAPLINPATLCGSMFGLGVDGFRLQRHRWFETSFPLLAPTCQHDKRPVIGIYGAHVRHRRRPTGKNHRSGSNLPWEYAFAAFGVPIGSMTLTELSEAIPPIFARFIVEAFLRSREGGHARVADSYSGGKS
jgi:DNA (cytosine-5)-methyltransferase 1